MKRVLIILSLVLSLAAARAGLVMKQNVKSAMVNGTVTTRINGDKIRVDMPSSSQGAMSTIMDLNTGDSVTLLHKEKVAMKISGAQIKEMAEKMREARVGANTNAPPPKFHDTGKTGKVGNYNTEVYTWSGADGESQTVWVAKHYPNYAKIKTEMDKLNNSPVAQMSKGAAPDISTLPGMVVKTQSEMNGQTITSTLISATEEPVDVSIFEAPKDYHEMTQPVGGSAPRQ